MQVNPGYTFTADEAVDAAKLNLAAVPTIILEGDDLDAENIDAEALRVRLGAGAMHPNYLRNGNFAANMWSRGTTAIDCTVGQLTYRADHWFVLPEYVDSLGGPIPGAVAYSREQSGPNISSLHCARLVGDTAVQIVDFGQDIASHLAAALRTTISISFYLYNDTGADLTPSLRFETADAVDNFTSTTLRATAAASEAVATGNWERFTFSVNAAAYTNITNGLRFIIRFPTGALSSSAKAIRISQVKVEIGATATAFVVERDEKLEGEDDADASSPSPHNFLDNPAFDLHRWIAPETTALLLTDNFATHRWWVLPTGASTAVITRDASYPANRLSAFAVKITGETGVTAVNFGQNLEHQTTTATLRNAVFSIAIFNNTGTAFVPILRIDTCVDLHSYDNTLNQVVQALDSCPNNAWTVVSYAFNGSLVDQWELGARLYIEIPTGSLDSNGKSVMFAQACLELGTVASDWEPVPDWQPNVSIAEAKNLSIYNLTGTGHTVTITADDVILTAPEGRAMNSGRIASQVVNVNTAGAGGLDTGTKADNWYYIWAISNGDTVTGIASLSAASPTLPVGYRFRALLGVAKYDGTDFRQFRQWGKKGCQKIETLINAVAANTNRNQVSAPLTANAIPPNAVAIGGTMGASNNVQYMLSLCGADDTTGQVTTNGVSGAPAQGGIRGGAPYWMHLFNKQTVFWQSGDTIASIYVSVTNYELE